MPSPSRIGLCLALGALTTVVVAWVLAVRVVVPVSPGARSVAQGMYRGSDGGSWWYQVQRRPGLTVVVRERARRLVGARNGEVTVMLHFPWRGHAIPDGSFFVSGLTPTTGAEIPAWARQPRLDPAVKTEVVTAASARGWPCRALWYEATMSPGSRVNRGGIDLPQSFREVGPGPVLPYRLILVGFAADMVFFGVSWMLLLVVPGLVRCGTRRRHGLCVECGYDLRHVGHNRCPECGLAAGCDERPLHQLGLRAWVNRSTSP